MKLTRNIFFLIGLALLCGGTYFAMNVIASMSYNGNPCGIRNSVLKNGDLVFRQGRSVESYAVNMADSQKEFSHVGIVVVIKGKAYIVHAVPADTKQDMAYVKMETPDQFLASDKATRSAVYRSGFSPTQLESVSRQALNFYNLRYTFDDEFDLSTPTKLYCTELVLDAFRNAGIELNDIKASEINFLVTKLKIILPGEFMKNASFRQVNNY